MNYTVTFDVFGKKFRTKLEASNPEEVKYKILGKIKFDSIEPILSKSEYDLPDGFEDIFNIFRK